MGTSVVVVLDPRPNSFYDFLQRGKSPLPDALAFEGFVVGFDHAVLLRRVRMDELLVETIGFEKPAIHARGKDEPVIATDDHARVAAGQNAEALDASILKGPNRFLCAGRSC